MSIPLARYWSILVDYLRPHSSRVVLLAVLVVGETGLQVVSPQIIRAFIDTVVAGASGGLPSVTRDLTIAALAYLGIAVISQGLSIGITYLGETVAWAATNALRRDLTLHCLRLDMSFHKAHTPGELIERIDGDVAILANFFSQMAIRLLSNGLLAGAILGALFYEDWRVGLAGTGSASDRRRSHRAIEP